MTVLSMKERIAVHFSAMLRWRGIARTRGKMQVHELARRARHARFAGAAMATRVA
ncbi:MAG: hypothetical protein H7Y19_00705 [Luteimonas sp.]|nr:hypothetical protein [Luteimonas sp.]